MDRPLNPPLNQNQFNAYNAWYNILTNNNTNFQGAFTGIELADRVTIFTFRNLNIQGQTLLDMADGIPLANRNVTQVDKKQILINEIHNILGQTIATNDDKLFDEMLRALNNTQKAVILSQLDSYNNTLLDLAIKRCKSLNEAYSKNSSSIPNQQNINSIWAIINRLKREMNNIQNTIYADLKDAILQNDNKKISVILEFLSPIKILKLKILNHLDEKYESLLDKVKDTGLINLLIDHGARYGNDLVHKKLLKAIQNNGYITIKITLERLSCEQNERTISILNKLNYNHQTLLDIVRYYHEWEQIPHQDSIAIIDLLKKHGARSGMNVVRIDLQNAIAEGSIEKVLKILNSFRAEQEKEKTYIINALRNNINLLDIAMSFQSNESYFPIIKLLKDHGAETGSNIIYKTLCNAIQAGNVQKVKELLDSFSPEQIYIINNLRGRRNLLDTTIDCLHQAETFLALACNNKKMAKKDLSILNQKLDNYRAIKNILKKHDAFTAS